MENTIQMKILIVNTLDIRGGAARAAYRLHKALLDQNINSQMLVQKKASDDLTVLVRDNWIIRILNYSRLLFDQLPAWFYKDKTETLFSTSWIWSGRIVKDIDKINPDIVHLHWICRGMLRVEDIKKIKAPIVWSLHDMWAFTGGCHYDEGCGAYKNNCGKCKVLGSNNSRDLSRKVFDRKQKVFSEKNDMVIVGLSNWLKDCSKKSTLLRDKKHINLPNPIDTSIFKLFNKEKSRRLWNLPKNKKLVLFGAMSATSDPRKGFKELSKAIKKIKRDDVEFVVFGSDKPKKSQNFGFKTHYLGSLNDDASLVALYNAVDVMIVPSLQENLSNTIMESLACATPVVGFNIGGNSDMIDHKKNGYLAKPFDTTDLKDGIEWVLNNQNYDELCQNAKEKVLKEFDSVVVAKEYVKLYKSILKKDNNWK